MKRLLTFIGLIVWAVISTAAVVPPAEPLAAFAADGDAKVEAPLAWPVEGRFLQGFSGYHRGVDLGAPYWTPLGAAADGVVTEVAWETGYGNYVVIDHGNGVETLYAHLAEADVEPGQPVALGDLVGLVGATGRATTSHVHFEVHVNGRAVNPLLFLP